MSAALYALANLDRFLSGLMLDREDHGMIQIHVTKLRQEIETAGQKGRDDA